MKTAALQLALFALAGTPLLPGADARLVHQVKHNKRNNHLAVPHAAREKRQIVATGGGNSQNGAAGSNTIPVGEDAATTPVTNNNPATNNAPNSPAASPTTGGGLLDTLLNPGGASSVRDAVTGVDSGRVAIPPSSTGNTALSSAATSSETSTAAPSTEEEALTTVITSTQETSEVPSASTSAESQREEEGSSGLSTRTIIIIASVAGSIGLIAAIWTILRKWKFSPSRRFERRLAPIDWTPEDLPPNEKGTPPQQHTPDLLQRTASDDDMSLKRGNSWGSANGSQRGLMSEVSYGGRNNSGAYNPTPAYPPVYPQQTHYPQPQQMTNPYEQVHRQTSQVNGGRYGEGYNHY